MDLLREMLRFHTWATVTLIEYCLEQQRELMEELVVGTDRSILHTLTHVVGTEEWYLQLLTGEPAENPIRQGEVKELEDLKSRCERQGQLWETVLDRFGELDLTLNPGRTEPEIPHAQNVLVLQSIQHGIDHRAQIYSTLAVHGLVPPLIDDWGYWAERHSG